MSYEVYCGTLASIAEYANKKCAKIIKVNDGYNGFYDCLLEIPTTVIIGYDCLFNNGEQH